jgi:uncharacterized protein (TIGR03435 family)
MRRSEHRIDELLDRGFTRFGEPSQEQMASDLARLRERLDPVVTRPLTKSSTDPRHHPARRWLMTSAAAAGLVVVAAALVWDVTSKSPARTVVESVDGPLYRVVEGEVRAIRAGSSLDIGSTVRTNGGAGAMLTLADGSHVEMRSRSELALERAADGMRVRLMRGGIIVSAAKQRDGHLYVETKEVTVAVVGTVFLVNAEEAGSRVAVIEGQVRVTQGATEKQLLPGEQVVSNPVMVSPPVSEAIAWSRNVESHVALLQQASVAAPVRAPQSPGEPRVAFEEVSIRWRQGSGGGGGGGRGQARGMDAAGGPCESAGQVQLDPRRLAVTRAGLLWLITAAYGVGPRGEEGNFDVRCRNAVAMKLLTEGPDWVRTLEFDVQAVLPPGTPAYTERQVERGEAPEIQRMLQTMLAERFKLVLKREAKEMPVYVLSVAPGGPKLTPAKERPATIERDGGISPANPSSMSTGLSLFPDCARLRRMTDGQVDERGADRCRRFDYGADTVVGHIRAYRASIDRVAASLRRLTERPIVNRTGISGAFDVDLLFAPTQPMLAVPVAGYVGQGKAILSGPSLFKALEDQMGLRLESSQVPVETFVIESVERPTEN